MKLFALPSSLCLIACLVQAALTLPGCAAEYAATAPPTTTTWSTYSSQALLYGPHDDDLDLGQDWSKQQPRQFQRRPPAATTPAQRQPSSPRQPSTPPQTSSPPPSPTPAPSRPQATSHPSPPPPTSSPPRTSPPPVNQSSEPTWSIVLGTFTGEGHAEAAQAMLRQLSSFSPDIGSGAFARATDRGSMALYGSYAGPDDPQARADLERIKAITVRDAPAFPRAFLTRIRPQAQPQADHPHALVTARREHPNVQTLYTLQIASWSDFDTGELGAAEIRRRAEAYASELRGKGHKAYFHHDDRTRISIVTVGVFDTSSIDLQSGVESAQLRNIRRQFPAHLVNGEPLHELIDRRNPNLGTRLQQPRLVLVPRP